MLRNRTLAALLGLCAGLAACEDTVAIPPSPSSGRSPPIPRQR